MVQCLPSIDSRREGRVRHSHGGKARVTPKVFYWIVVLAFLALMVGLLYVIP
ncbi:MAG: hypothetical protein ABSB53_00860 [Nitrososphaerales archaeon]